MTRLLCVSGIVVAAVVGCGHNSGGNVDDGDIGGGEGIVVVYDARVDGATCTIGGPFECVDCIDNDQDGKIDGFDPECSGSIDDREDSFATGIVGDHVDTTMQDCFFDGN